MLVRWNEWQFQDRRFHSNPQGWEGLDQAKKPVLRRGAVVVESASPDLSWHYLEKDSRCSGSYHCALWLQGIGLDFEILHLEVADQEVVPVEAYLDAS